jgi:hypothetical protein
VPKRPKGIKDFDLGTLVKKFVDKDTSYIEIKPENECMKMTSLKPPKPKDNETGSHKRENWTKRIP